jgi:DNA mismatch repair protein MutL
VENRAINYALVEAYHTSLMKGRYPVCCLFLELNPAEVDVNIHPAKREVKFRQERAIRNAVADAIRRALLAYHTGNVSTNSAAAPTMPKPTTVAPPEEKPSATATTAEPANLSPGTNRKSSSFQLEPQVVPPPVPLQQHIALFRNSPAVVPSVQQNPGNEPEQAATQPFVGVNDPRVLNANVSTASPTETPPRASANSSSSHLPLLEVPLRLIGVVGKLYVLLESDRGLVLLDQHAAHERILYEQMMRRLESEGRAPSQRLLLPETIELGVRDSTFVRDQLPTLVRLGVGLSEFGDRTFLLDALPPFVKAGRPRQFVLELVDQLKAAGELVNSLRLGEHVVAKTVCRHAVKANDPLAPAELENLVADLRRCEMPYTCPHGRPTLIEMNYKELEKKFGRTQ